MKPVAPVTRTVEPSIEAFSFINPMTFVNLAVHSIQRPQHGLIVFQDPGHFHLGRFIVLDQPFVGLVIKNARRFPAGGIFFSHRESAPGSSEYFFPVQEGISPSQPEAACRSSALMASFMLGRVRANPTGWLFFSAMRHRSGSTMDFISPGGEKKFLAVSWERSPSFCSRLNCRRPRCDPSLYQIRRALRGRMLKWFLFLSLEDCCFFQIIRNLDWGMQA